MTELSLAPLVRWCVHQVTGQFVTRQDDLFQVGMIAAWQASERYVPGPATLETYVAHRVRGAVRDELRRTPPPTEPLLDHDAACHDADPAAIYAERDACRVFQAAWAALPPRERYVMGCLYLDERRARDVAAELGVTESRVSAIRSRAARRLAVALEGVF